MQECPMYVWTPPYIWMPCIYLDAPYVWTPPHVWMPPLCFDDVWMPPVHKQYKESMLCQTKGVSICPIHLDAPIYLDGCLYVWMPSICLDAPCMF